jgi:CubicO group peptidase (beta-lactamase class C family)
LPRAASAISLNSVAKSFTNALLAVLVRQGRLAVDQPIGAPEWAGPGDPRAALTIEDLLRMRSGLDAPESDSAAGPVAQMEFLSSDMAGFAAAHPLKHAPGAEFEYTSANTIIVDRLIGQFVGGGPMGLRAFAEREIFGLALGKWRALLKERGAFHGQPAATVWEGI